LKLWLVRLGLWGLMAAQCLGLLALFFLMPDSERPASPEAEAASTRCVAGLLASIPLWLSLLWLENRLELRAKRAQCRAILRS